MAYQKILFEKEKNYFGEDGGARYTVYVDNGKFAEHLRFDEVIKLLNMIEEREAKGA